MEEENVLDGLKSSLAFMFDNGVKDEDIAILVWTNRDILKVEQFIKEVFNKDSITSSRAKVIHQQFAMAVINL